MKRNQRCQAEIETIHNIQEPEEQRVAMASSRQFETYQTEELQTRREELQEESEKLQRRGLQNSEFAASLLEIMSVRRSNGTLLSSTTIENGVMLRLNGTSSHGIEHFSKSSMSISPSSCRRAEDLLCGMEKDEAKDYIDTLLKDNKVSIVLQDNYNPSKYLKRFYPNKPFSNTVSSETIIFRPFTKSRFFLYDPCGNNKANISNTYQTGSADALLRAGIDIPEELKDIRDESFLRQSISDWSTLPSVPGKSSVLSDFEDLILKNVYLKLFRLADCEVFTSPDIEYIPILLKLNKSYPALDNLIVTISFWHLRKHLLENFFADPVISLIFWLPLIYDFFKFRENKIKDQKLAKIAKMNSFTKQVEDENEEEDDNQVPLMNKVQKVTAEFFQENRYELQALNSLNEVEDFESINESQLYNITLISSEELHSLSKTIFQFIENGGRNKGILYKELQEGKLNYARLLNITQYVVAAFRESRKELLDIAHDTPDYSLCRLLFDFLENGLDSLGTKPFEKVIMEGRGQLLMSNFPKILGTLLHYGRLKVFSGYFSTFRNYQHYAKHRKDLMEMILSNITKTNDEYIELKNSLISRTNPSTQVDCFGNIQKAALLSGLKSEINKKVVKSAIPIGEIPEEESKPKTEGGRKLTKNLKAFLLNLFRFYAEDKNDLRPSTKSLGNPNLSEIVEHNFTQIYSVDDMVEHGFESSNQIYDAYWHNIQKQGLKADENEDNDIFEALLRKKKMTKTLLLYVLSTKKIQLPKNSHKATLIRKIKEVFPSLSAFQTYISQNKS